MTRPFVNWFLISTDVWTKFSNWEVILLMLNTDFHGVQIIFDNILNRKIPWPSVPSDMSYEAQDLIYRLVVGFAPLLCW